MKITLPYVIALVVRGEGSKTPTIVYPHEVEILKAMHGEDSVTIASEDAPVKEGTFDTEDEYVRLQGMYKGDNDNPNPTVRVFRNLDEFESAFGAAVGENKADLLAKAIELGVPANKQWSLAKIKQAIAEIENA